MEQLDLLAQEFGDPELLESPLEGEGSPEVEKLTYEDYPIEDLMTYAGIDCIVTSGVATKLWPTLTAIEEMKVPTGKGFEVVEAPPIIQSVNEVEMPAHEFILDLEINGIGYSVERNRFYHNKMVDHIAELDEKIFSAVGKTLDMNSGPALAEFLYSVRGFTPPYLTKAGEPAVDGDALMLLAGLDPTGKSKIAKDEGLQFLVWMAIRRDISSVHNTFIKTYHTDWVKRDGRIHPSYNLFGTSSFRITGSDPNLTQLPREKHGYNIRTCFIEGEGNVFISFDFSSAEVKILANMAKEPGMLKAIADGLDFHTFSASAMDGVPYGEMAEILEDQTNPRYKECKARRQQAKVLTFSLLYGSSVGGIAQQLYITVEKAQELMDLYFRTFPKVKDFIEESHKMALWNQYVITPLNQRKREYGTLPCFKYTASYNAALRNSQNVRIQSTTSSIGLITFAELNERIKKFNAKSTCTVYDSLEICCPIEHAHEVINLCYETLDKWPVETFDFLELPIGCEGDVGISWGETKIVHPGTTAEDVADIIKRVKEESLTTFGKLILS